MKTKKITFGPVWVSSHSVISRFITLKESSKKRCVMSQMIKDEHLGNDKSIIASGMANLKKNEKPKIGVKTHENLEKEEDNIGQ